VQVVQNSSGQRVIYRCFELTTAGELLSEAHWIRSIGTFCWEEREISCTTMALQCFRIVCPLGRSNSSRTLRREWFRSYRPRWPCRKRVGLFFCNGVNGRDSERLARSRREETAMDPEKRERNQLIRGSRSAPKTNPKPHLNGAAHSAGILPVSGRAGRACTPAAANATPCKIRCRRYNSISLLLTILPKAEDEGGHLPLALPRTKASVLHFPLLSF